MKLITILFLAAFLFSSCVSEERATRKPERNVIKEFVNTPKDKARGAVKSAEDAQKRQQEMLDR